MKLNPYLALVTNIEDDHLDYYGTEENIYKAADELMISQPAVTKQLKTLENQLGGELFIRTKKGVILTDNGREIFNYVKHAITCFQNAEMQFSNLKNLEKGTIKIGVSTT